MKLRVKRSESIATHGGDALARRAARDQPFHNAPAIPQGRRLFSEYFNENWSNLNFSE
jgi:hypothetical protein